MPEPGDSSRRSAHRAIVFAQRFRCLTGRCPAATATVPDYRISAGGEETYGRATSHRVLRADGVTSAYHETER